MPDLHIIGAGGHAKVIVALAEAAGYYIAGIYDDSPAASPQLLGHKVTRGLMNVPDAPDTLAFLAIGGNALRQQFAERFTRVRWAALIHPAAWVAPDVSVGAGSVIMAGCVVQTGAQIGQHVIVNTLAGVDHDCILGDYVHIAPGCHLAGNVQLAQGVFAGVGAMFTPGSLVGAWSIVGAGALVSVTMPANVTAVGIPAKIIKVRPDDWQRGQS
jgi:acetyltransferase EpsM